MYERQHRYEQKKAREASDIGEIPPVANPERREACRLDLFRFLTTYFPLSTGRSPFSDDHRRVIDRIQKCILFGGWFVNAVYRGFAKTTISENAAVWAVLYNHRRFVPIFGAGASSADGNIESIKVELAENDLLYEDFPEVCHAIRALEGKPQRCNSQTYSGTPCPGCGGGKDAEDCPQCKGSGTGRTMTHIEWTADKIVLPHIPGSAASGNIITAHGIGAASRGLKHKRPDGTQQRPDFVIIDDPQTDESAATPLQVKKRLDIIRKSILKLGGHNRRMAVVMNATVIRPDDLIEQLLDHKRNPAWQGERIKMVKRFADAHESLWLGDYARVRTTYDPDTVDDQHRAHKEATELYRRSRMEMDKGCIVSWEHCYDPDAELSAVQHAYNSLIDDGPEVFASECQNEPLEAHGDTELLKPAEIAAKVNGIKRGAAPMGAEHLTAFIDVQGEVLYWAVCAWSPDFTGAIVDYGTYPEQNTRYFSLASATKTLAKDPAIKGAGLEGRIYAGLALLADQLLTREWKREDGAAMKIGRCVVDANWGKSTTTVNNFCRRSPHAALLMPSHGRYVGAASIPWEQYTRREGERLGHHWMIPSLKGKPSAVRHLLIDVNFWKSFVHTRLAVRLGDKGCLSLFGQNPDNHRLIADHLTAEYRVHTEGRGRRVDEWKAKPGKPDNHWFDCVVGAAAAASLLGSRLITEQPATAKPARKRRAVSYL